MRYSKILRWFRIDISHIVNWLIPDSGMQIRESPHNSHHKYIEFYDIRAAEAAVSAVNKGHVAGNQIKLEPGLRGDNIW